MKVNWKSALSLTLALVLTVSAVPATRVEASEAITDVMLSEENMEVVTQEIPGDDDSQTPDSDKELEEDLENEDLENEDLENDEKENSKNALDEEISSGVLEEKKEEAPDQKEEKEEATVSGSSLGKETTEESVSDSSLGLMPEETQQSESPIVEVEILAAEEENIASGTITNEQGGITWKIDAAGKLTVTGKGEIPDSDLGSPTVRDVPWRNYSEDITSAVIQLSEITDLSNFFKQCSNMTKVDVSGLDTQNVTNMEYMFYQCSALTQLDLSGLDTQNVINMKYMFGLCSALTQLDLSGLDTQNVTNMSDMFSGCESLKELDLSGFNTTNVTDMNDMFSGCRSLKNLNLSSFNTAKVTNMSHMFARLLVEELDLSRFNTAKVTDMSGMFNGCESLKELDLSGFNTTNVTDMSFMFGVCNSLTKLNISSFNTAKVTDMSGMFHSCQSLKELNLSSFNTGNVTTMEDMFFICPNLEELQVSHFDTSKVTNMKQMFSYCSSLTQLDVSSFDTGKVTDMYNMFSYCSSLTQIDVSNFNTGNVTNMRQIFSNCPLLKEVNLSNFDCSKVTDLTDMFSCYREKSQLERIHTPRNIPSTIKEWLPKEGDEKWYDAKGNIQNYLPQNLNKSIILQKGSIPNQSGQSNIPLKSIALSNTILQMKPQQQQILSVTYTPNNTTASKDVVWSSSNEDVAAVANGTVTAKAQGTTTITAKVGKLTATCKVVVAPTVTKIAIEPEDSSILVGETLRLSIKVEPEGYLPYDKITIENKNPENLSVKDKIHYGYLEVTGQMAGSAQLILQVDGQECKATILVKESTIQLKDFDGRDLHTITATIGEPLHNLSLPDKEDYVFAGWFLQVDEQGNGIGQEITSQTIFTNQEVLYATWHAVEEDQIWIKEIPQQLYTGAAIKPVVEVYKGKELLVSGKDYTVSYKNNTNVYEGNDDKKKPQVIVTGKGNYGQKVTKYFEILPKDLNDMGITIDEGLLIKAATKKVQKLVPTIKDGKKTLRSKTDFILTYPMESVEGAYQKAGQYRIIVTGKGNYKGTRTLQMRLVGDEATLITKASVKNVVTKPYSGNAIQQEPVITVGKTTLIKGQDYKLLYDNNVEIGTATMQIVGCGAYAGTKTVTFKITGTAISKAFIASGLENREYSGEEHRPQPVILKSKTSNQALVAGKDYLLSYSKNKEVGTANITITGIGAYTGTIKKSFKITAYDVKNTDISVEGEEALTVEYAVGGCNPKPTVKFKGEPLQQGVDYTVSYKNNTKLANNDAAKAPTLVITGKKNFKGSKTIFFSIVPASFDHLTLSAADIVEPKKADKWKTTLSVTNSNGKKLKAGTDYEKELIYSYAEDALMKDGTTKVKGTIVEKGDIPVAGSIIKVQIRSTGINYKANEIASTTYRIVDSTKNISKGTFKIQDKYFTGQEIIIQGNDFTKAEISKLPPLGYGSDYEIIEGSYKNNIKKGTASVMLRGINTYYGTKTVSFKIVPKNLNSQN